MHVGTVGFILLSPPFRPVERIVLLPKERSEGNVIVETDFVIVESDISTFADAVNSWLSRRWCRCSFTLIISRSVEKDGCDDEGNESLPL